MAYSLVKDDPGYARSAELWRELREWLAVTHPGTVLLPESERRAPRDIGVRGGFDADFFVVNQQEHSALFNNGGAGTLPWLPDHRGCFFGGVGADGAGGAEALGMFLRLWEEHRAAAGDDRLVIVPSSDHDYSRLVTGSRTQEQLGSVFAFLLSATTRCRLVRYGPNLDVPVDGGELPLFWAGAKRGGDGTAGRPPGVLGDACPQRTFREPVPELALRYARRTLRLAMMVGRLAIALAGRAGARVLTGLGIPIWHSTVLRVLMALPIPQTPTPTVLSVDHRLALDAGGGLRAAACADQLAVDHNVRPALLGHLAQRLVQVGACAASTRTPSLRYR